MTDAWIATIPALEHFSQVADPAFYRPLPDDWHVGVSDVVNSTEAIADRRYNAVNLAGAGTICAVANALGGDLPLFVFGGDGARFAVGDAQAPAAADALARTAAWAKRDLGLGLRVGMVPVAEIRAAGHDVRVAFWKASAHVKYAMFTGGGLEWADRRLKEAAAYTAPGIAAEMPDLTGLSCQWSPIRSTRGAILSLIAKPAPGAPADAFIALTAKIVAILEASGNLNPVPASGPAVHWPASTIELQSRVARGGNGLWSRRLRVVAASALIWLIFRLGLRMGRFDPRRYRREIGANTDFRKFDDGLFMTVDCLPATLDTLRAVLAEGAAAGIVRYGLHVQDEALMTCIVPSAMSPDHVHFVDGAGGGYAAAAAQLRG